jgi:hypothetical protein
MMFSYDYYDFYLIFLEQLLRRGGVPLSLTINNNSLQIA